MKTAQVVQIVVNPHAGRARGLQILEPLTVALKAHGYQPEVLIMHGPRNALRYWAKQCPSRTDYLVSLGGDDTLDDLTYAALRHQVPLIAVPMGFGNACARHFGHHAAVPAILDLLERGDCIQVDVALQEVAGEDSPSVFLSAAIYGFLRMVKHTAEQAYFLRRRYFRTLHYMISAAKSLSPSFPLPTLAVEVDGELLTDEAAVAIVSNVPAFPGHLLFTPDASPLDGLLDVCVILAESSLGLLSHLFSLRFGSASVERHLIRRRGRKIKVTEMRGPQYPASLPFTGSQLTGRAMETLTIQPRAVPVLVAPTVVPQEARNANRTEPMPIATGGSVAASRRA